jgi:hypothetical protein
MHLRDFHQQLLIVDALDIAAQVEIDSKTVAKLKAIYHTLVSSA